VNQKIYNVETHKLRTGQTMSEKSLATGYKKLRTDKTGIIYGRPNVERRRLNDRSNYIRDRPVM